MSPATKPAGNNLKHGFRSSTVLLPGDDPAEYQALHTKLLKHFRPTDLTEDRLIREMADSEWRLRRVRQMIESALTRHMATVAAADPALTGIDLQSKAIETLADTGCSYSTWLRYESKFQNQYDRAYRTWTRYQQDCRRLSAKQTNQSIEDAIFGPMPSARPSNVQSTTAQSHTPTTTVQSIPRNSHCPCGSGDKYKRCCGRNAPAVLGAPAMAGLATPVTPREDFLRHSPQAA